VAVGDRVVTDGQLRLSPGATVVIEGAGRGPAAPVGEERRTRSRS
jgi:hypothetical protein